MPDTAPKDFSTTAASNSTVGGINIAEGSTAAQLNDAIRATLAVVKTGDWGASGISADIIAESTAGAGVTIDNLLIKDGALPGLTLGDTIPVGTPFPTFASTPSTGYLMMNGDTLGNASSSADQDSNDYEALFTYLYDNISNTYAAVSGGRGANAAADWAANKTITIPDPTNRAFFGAGDTYAAGETGGAATHTLTQAQLPAIRLLTHVNKNTSDTTPSTLSASNAPVKSNDKGDREAYTSHGDTDEPTVGRTSVLGSGAAHNNLPPFLAIYYQIKY
jgi:microcystin-dependent protein